MVEVKLFNCPSYLGFRTVASSEKVWFIFVGFLYLVRCLESRKFRVSLGRFDRCQEWKVESHVYSLQQLL